MTLDEKGLVLVDVKISPESNTVGKAVKDLSLPKDSKLALIIPTEGSAHVPVAHTVLQAGDQIIAITPPESKEALKAALGGI
jgi:Trk K+ transport system NAD-binding subunit